MANYYVAVLISRTTSFVRSSVLYELLSALAYTLLQSARMRASFRTEVFGASIFSSKRPKAEVIGCQKRSICLAYMFTFAAGRSGGSRVLSGFSAHCMHRRLPIIDIARPLSLCDCLRITLLARKILRKHCSVLTTTTRWGAFNCVGWKVVLLDLIYGR